MNAQNHPIAVWDLPTRIGHWLLVSAFAVAWLTGESESWRAVHVAAGAVMVTVVLFRLVWGGLGSRYARFSSFAFAPSAVRRYLKSLLQGQPEEYVGHNPAGSYAIYLLLAATLVTAGTGWVAYNELGGEWSEELHEALASGFLGLVGVHVAGVVVSSLLHRENLVRAMVTGKKQGRDDQAIGSWRPWAAIVLVLLVGAAIWGSRFL